MWKFPEELGLAVRQHKKPLEFEEPQPLSATLNLACYINAAIRESRDEETVKESFPTEIAVLAGVNPNVVESLAEALGLESGLDGLAD